MMKKLLVAVALACLASPVWAQTPTNHTVTLHWTNPTTRVGGAALAPSEIARVDVIDSMVSGVPLGTIQGGTTATFTSGGLASGTHALTLIWTDTTGNQSGPSNTMSVVVPVPLAPPSPGVLNSAVLN